MRNKLLELIIVAVTTAVAAFLKEVIFKENNITNYVYSVAISIGCLLLFYLLAYGISRLIKVEDKYKCVGNFIEVVNKNNFHHISFFSIKHDFFEDKFKIKGDTFDIITGRHYAEWWSISVGFLGDGKVYYLHSAALSGKKGEITGLTRLNFVASNEYYSEGTGYIVDNAEPLAKISFEFERITRSEIKELIGKSKIKNREDRLLFIKKWAQVRNLTAEIGKKHNG